MTNLSPREKELVEAVKAFRRVAPYSDDEADALEMVDAALRAYDHPKREYAIPSWEDFCKGLDCVVNCNEGDWQSITLPNRLIIQRRIYETIRDLTSKEVKP